MSGNVSKKWAQRQALIVYQLTTKLSVRGNDVIGLTVDVRIMRHDVDMEVVTPQFHKFQSIAVFDREGDGKEGRTNRADTAENKVLGHNTGDRFSRIECGWRFDIDTARSRDAEGVRPTGICCRNADINATPTRVHSRNRRRDDRPVLRALAVPGLTIAPKPEQNRSAGCQGADHHPATGPSHFIQFGFLKASISIGPHIATRKLTQVSQVNVRGKQDCGQAQRDGQTDGNFLPIFHHHTPHLFATADMSFVCDGESTRIAA